MSAERALHARRTAVVGGGWAGLAAAVEAAGRGDAVTLFEMAPALGGRARRLPEAAAGLRLDNGQHILIGAYVETLRLLARVGVAERDALRRLPLQLTDAQGRGLRLPAGAALPAFVRGVLAARGWRLGERLALLAAASGWLLRGFRCDPAASVAELTARLPAALRRGWVEPLCVAALNTPADRASAQVFLNVLRAALFAGPGAADLLLPRVDLGALFPDAAARWLTERGAALHSGRRVQALVREAQGWRIVTARAADATGLATASAPTGTAPFGSTPSGKAPSGIAEAGIAEAGTAQAGAAQAGIASGGIAPPGIAPSGITPAGIALSGIALSGRAASERAPSGVTPSGPAPLAPAETDPMELAAGEEPRFDRVLLCCSAIEAARLAEPHAPDWSALARGLRHEPIVTVLLRCPGAALPAPMLALDSTDEAPAQFVFDLGQLRDPALEPAAAGVLAFVISGAARCIERGLERTARQVQAQARAQLVGLTSGEPQLLKVLSEKRATFLCTPGLRRPPAQVAPGLVAAGDYVDGPYPATLEGAVRSGLAAAAD